MRSGRERAILQFVERVTAHLHLAIETGSDPIAGLLWPPNGRPHRFNGWVELTGAIEQARRDGVAATRENSNGSVPLAEHDTWAEPAA